MCKFPITAVMIILFIVANRQVHQSVKIPLQLSATEICFVLAFMAGNRIGE
jgi:uncharacterized PurR-regulated membrane protein YhhQ (DUF165 family)